MRLLCYFSLNVFVLLTILSLIDAFFFFTPNKSAPTEKSCLNYCSNNGICVMADDGPKCYCLPRWMGTRCDDMREPAGNARLHFFKSALPRAVTPCPTSLKVACEHGGDCHLLNGNQLICICPATHTGDFCEIKLQECPAGFCANGATCIPSSNPNTAPTCNCAPDQTGFDCKTALTTTSTTTETTTTPSEFCKTISTLQINYCQNGGTCEFDTAPKCRCPPTFTGQKCETPVGASPSTPSSSEQPNPSTTPGQPNPSTTPGQPNPSTTPGQPNPSTTPGQPNPSTTPGQPNPSTTPGLITNLMCDPDNNPCANGRPCYKNGNSYFCYCGPNYSGVNCQHSNNG